MTEAITPFSILNLALVQKVGYSINSHQYRSTSFQFPPYQRQGLLELPPTLRWALIQKGIEQRSLGSIPHPTRYKLARASVGFGVSYHHYAAS